MPIDREKALGADLGETTGSYGPDDVILYHLGIGAGFRATDPGSSRTRSRRTSRCCRASRWSRRAA